MVAASPRAAGAVSAFRLPRHVRVPVELMGVVHRVRGAGQISSAHSSSSCARSPSPPPAAATLCLLACGGCTWDRADSRLPRRGNELRVRFIKSYLLSCIIIAASQTKSWFPTTEGATGCGRGADDTQNEAGSTCIPGHPRISQPKWHATPPSTHSGPYPTPKRPTATNGEARGREGKQKTLGPRVAPRARGWAAAVPRLSALPPWQTWTPGWPGSRPRSC